VVGLVVERRIHGIQCPGRRISILNWLRYFAVAALVCAAGLTQANEVKIGFVNMDRLLREAAPAIRALKKEGLSVLLSEQNLHFAAEVSDRAYIIEKGRIRFAGTMAELAADADVRAQYLAV
jgi:ABC-type branched-subunit amino acid transport system ATPase component